jgi:glycerophosphoryl diester phosphodiesterase
MSGLENSMVSFRRAVDEGLVYLETDVHATKDGRLVAFHDSVLDRKTDGTGRIIDLTWDQLRHSRIGGKEPIPLFGEILDLLEQHPQLRVNVDPKADTAVGPLLDALQHSPVRDRINLGAFSDARLRALRTALGPDQSTSLGPGEAARLLLRSRLPFVPVRPAPPGIVAAQIPLTANGVRVTTRALVDRAHAEGMEVHVWTIDDPDQMRRLLDLGVDGIMTDRPDLLLAVLAERS